MNPSKNATSGFDKETLRRMKYASVESKFHALTEMIRLAQEAQKSCKKRGVKFFPL